MLIILKPGVTREAPEYSDIRARLTTFSGVEVQSHVVRGTERLLTELYLVGNTRAISSEQLSELPGIERVVRISDLYRIIGRLGEPGGRFCARSAGTTT